MAPRLSSRRDAVLREMGLGPIWRLRARQAESEGTEDFEQDAGAPVATEAAAALATPRAVAPRAPMFRPAEPAPAARPQPNAAIPRSTEPPRGHAARAQPASTPAPAATFAAPDPARSGRIATFDWEALEAGIRDCRACALCERRKQAVPGVGDRQARWMLVGEGPGAEEDQRGEPFVGQAGRLLDNMLAAIGLKRGEDVYIANAVKCRPPHNRTPERGEIAACLPYLDRQIALVQPRLLIALGRPAAQALLDREIAISAARGKRFERAGVAVVVTYHPAYLLRNPQDKAKAWEDLCFARRLMAEAG
ncbi:MAG: uracil-DNA glycosylase [Thauera sp.]|nr:uracil-DNA glycosylase [Thauera sp.]